jgi:CheY-like chemotaxis protein
MAEPVYKILIVDDVEVNRKLISAGLEGGKYDLSYAENGRRALDMLTSGNFDLMLLDIMMPEMTGYEVLEWMMENPTLREIPVVVISAVDDVKSISKCVRMGADDYLMKPIDLTLLRARVAASIDKKRSRDRIAEYLSEIDSERRRYDRLLGMVFPPQVAEELKETNEIRPRKFDSVAILFADVVGFTSYCAEKDPDNIVSHLQEMVVACEAIAAKFGLLKIKTIGDCFMATAGLLKPTENPVADAIRCGLEMISLVRMLDAGWTLRVGVHIGSVMTGLVGYRQHLYDVFGDAVNIAAHVQSTGVPGAVNVSADAWECVSSEFEADSRSTAHLKHRGDMEVFSIFPPSSDASEAMKSEPELLGEEDGCRTSL